MGFHWLCNWTQTCPDNLTHYTGSLAFVNSVYARSSVVDPWHFITDLDPLIRDPASDPDQDPSFFVSGWQGANKMQVFFQNFFCLLLFEGTFTSILKVKKSNRTHKIVEIKVSLTVFALWWKDRDPDPDPEARRHTDSMDQGPDPQCWYAECDKNYLRSKIDVPTLTSSRINEWNILNIYNFSLCLPHLPLQQMDGVGPLLRILKNQFCAG